MYRCMWSSTHKALSSELNTLSSVLANLSLNEGWARGYVIDHKFWFNYVPLGSVGWEIYWCRSGVGGRRSGRRSTKCWGGRWSWGGCGAGWKGGWMWTRVNGRDWRRERLGSVRFIFVRGRDRLRWVSQSNYILQRGEWEGGEGWIVEVGEGGGWDGGRG